MFWPVLAALVGVLVVVALVVWHRSRPGGSLILIEPKGAPSGPSLYDRIAEQVRKAPDKPVDCEGFPNVEGEEGGLSFAPGAIDAILGGPDKKGRDWKKVVEIIHAVNQGRITSWRVVENNLRGIRTSAYVDEVLDHLTTADVTPQVKKLFWEAAKKTQNYEIAKWGIAIGGALLTPEELPDVLIFARHGEFTLYAAHVLHRESEHHPEYRKHLVELLPVSRQWGVIRVIDYIVRDPKLISDHTVQEEVLVYGMKNNDGIPMEVAFTIAKKVDVPYFLTKAAKDARVFSATVSLFDTLLLDPQPLGGICDLENGRVHFDQYFALMESREPDIEVLGAFRSMEIFLDNEELKWDSRGALLERARALYAERISAEILRKGLRGDAGHRWVALQIIKDRKLTDLLPDVVEAFEKEPDGSTIEVLGMLGDKSHLQAMMGKIPEIVDLDERRNHPFSAENVMGPEYTTSLTYAWIVEHLGRLGTPEAVVHIKRAAADYHPMVRNAAMEAVLALPENLIDDELRALVKERLGDPPDYVAEATKKAAEKLGLRVQKKGKP